MAKAPITAANKSTDTTSNGKTKSRISNSPMLGIVFSKTFWIVKGVSDIAFQVFISYM